MSKPIKLLAAVELGSPAADCAHFGICSVEVITPQQWATYEPRHIRQVKAEISSTLNGMLRFEFPIEAMRADTFDQFFPEEGFRVDSARSLPDSITIRLGLKLGLRVLPGIYQLKLIKTSIVVELELVYQEMGLAFAA
jgi:hypothetical protein